MIHIEHSIRDVRQRRIDSGYALADRERFCTGSSAEFDLLGEPNPRGSRTGHLIYLDRNQRDFLHGERWDRRRCLDRHTANFEHWFQQRPAQCFGQLFIHPDVYRIRRHGG